MPRGVYEPKQPYFTKELEADYQKALVAACRAQGGWAIRLSPIQRYGVPDLLLQLPSVPAAYVETKVVNFEGSPSPGTRFTVGVTPLQRETLKEIRKAGGLAAIWVYVCGYTCVVKAFDADDVYVSYMPDNLVRKERGEQWPIKLLIELSR